MCEYAFLAIFSTIRNHFNNAFVEIHPGCEWIGFCSPAGAITFLPAAFEGGYRLVKFI